MGEEQIDGVTYQKVFATWFDPRPANDHDQIVFYINADSHRLEKLHYTCRDSGFGFFSATIHYQDYKNVNGILESQHQTITFGGPNDRFLGSLIFLHQIDMQDSTRYY